MTASVYFRSISTNHINDLLMFMNITVSIIFLFFLQRIDLSGCIQITPYFLFLSLVSSSCNMDPSSRRGVFERLIEFEHPKWNCYPVSKELLSTMSFESVQELDVSKNPWPRVDAVIKCINMSFPSLKLLKATHCLNFQMKTLCDVVQNCPQIIEIDLTVDISSVIPARVSVISASTEPYQGLENASYKMLKERMLSSNLTKLTLEGRTDINGKTVFNCLRILLLNDLFMNE